MTHTPSGKEPSAFALLPVEPRQRLVDLVLVGDVTVPSTSMSLSLYFCSAAAAISDAQ